MLKNASSAKSSLLPKLRVRRRKPPYDRPRYALCLPSLLPRRDEGPMLSRQKGKFWPFVRPLIWEKAQELFQEEEARHMQDDFKGIRAERHELREAGYFHIAKLIVLRDLWLQKKGLSTADEEAQVHAYL